MEVSDGGQCVKTNFKIFRTSVTCVSLRSLSLHLAVLHRLNDLRRDCTFQSCRNKVNVPSVLLKVLISIGSPSVIYHSTIEIEIGTRRRRTLITLMTRKIDQGSDYILATMKHSEILIAATAARQRNTEDD